MEEKVESMPTLMRDCGSASIQPLRVARGIIRRG
jgi:hypothetical protein